jgi:hypothetical protein
VDDVRDPIENTRLLSRLSNPDLMDPESRVLSRKNDEEPAKVPDMDGLRELVNDDERWKDAENGGLLALAEKDGGREGATDEEGRRRVYVGVPIAGSISVHSAAPSAIEMRRDLAGGGSVAISGKSDVHSSSSFPPIVSSISDGK